MLKRNLYLLGFMGSGKSHVGKVLSKDLNVPFIDLDTFIESEAQCTIDEIFATKGEVYFRKLEAICLRQLKTAKAVIALGGGTPCFLNNNAWIRATGNSFFLDPAIPILIERLLGETEKRPLLKGKSKAELGAFIQDKLDERRPFYEQATYSIKKTTAQKIIQKIKEKMKHQKLLVLHGALGSRAQLEPLKKALEDSFEVHTLNFRGHGGRDFGAENFSIDCFTEDVLNYLQEQNLDKVAILGYSMGGYVALNLAKKHPNRVGKIFTLATKFAWSIENASKEVKMLNPDLMEEKVPAFAAVLKERHAPLNWKLHLKKTAEMMLELGEGAGLSSEDFSAITNEVLITVGSKDRMVSQEESEGVANLLPNGKFELLEGFKHPIEQVDLAFLAKKVTSFF
ncbi:MAG: alpha/beta fold hydrolase [Aureispira sp.]|nr:alpha/beta fold hydrolase [Aureispira sp.]